MYGVRICTYACAARRVGEGSRYLRVVDIGVDDVDGEVAQAGEAGEVPAEGGFVAGEGRGGSGVEGGVDGGVWEGGLADCGKVLVVYVDDSDCGVLGVSVVSGLVG